MLKKNEKQETQLSLEWTDGMPVSERQQIWTPFSD